MRPIALLVAVFFFLACGDGKQRAQWQPDSSDADADGDSDADSDGDSDGDTGTSTGEGCGSSTGDATVLQVEATLDIPSYRTGVPSVFTDVFVHQDTRIYLVSDEQQCDLALQDGAPVFAGSGSFCALTPGYSLRGWTKYGGQDHIVDADSKAVVSGNGVDTYALPDQLFSPSGLTSDGTAFWISDASSPTLYRLTPGGAVTEVASPPAGVDSVSFDGSQLWVLSGTSIYELSLQGQVCRTFTTTKNLSGFTVSPSGSTAFATDESQAILYRFSVPQI